MSLPLTKVPEAEPRSCTNDSAFPPASACRITACCRETLVSISTTSQRSAFRPSIMHRPHLRLGGSAHGGGAHRCNLSGSTPLTRKTILEEPRRKVAPSASRVGSASGSRRVPSCGTASVRPSGSYHVPCAESKSTRKQAEDELRIAAWAREMEESSRRISATPPCRPSIHTARLPTGIDRVIAPRSTISSTGWWSTAGFTQSGGRQRGRAAGTRPALLTASELLVGADAGAASGGGGCSGDAPIRTG
eukprot:scaffold47917_cov32-Tisochrysis_lutea.AAC.4